MTMPLDLIRLFWEWSRYWKGHRDWIMEDRVAQYYLEGWYVMEELEEYVPPHIAAWRDGMLTRRWPYKEALISTIRAIRNREVKGLLVALKPQKEIP